MASPYLGQTMDVTQLAGPVSCRMTETTQFGCLPHAETLLSRWKLQFADRDVGINTSELATCSFDKRYCMPKANHLNRIEGVWQIQIWALKQQSLHAVVIVVSVTKLSQVSATPDVVAVASPCRMSRIRSLRTWTRNHTSTLPTDARSLH